MLGKVDGQASEVENRGAEIPTCSCLSVHPVLMNS